MVTSASASPVWLLGSCPRSQTGAGIHGATNGWSVWVGAASTYVAHKEKQWERGTHNVGGWKPSWVSARAAMSVTCWLLWQPIQWLTAAHCHAACSTRSLGMTACSSSKAARLDCMPTNSWQTQVTACRGSEAARTTSSPGQTPLSKRRRNRRDTPLPEPAAPALGPACSDQRKHISWWLAAGWMTILECLLLLLIFDPARANPIHSKHART